MDSSVSDLLGEAVHARVAPAVVAEVGRSDGPPWAMAFGSLTYDATAPAAGLETIFDLASLTKVIVTTTMAMRLADAGRLDLAMPVGAALPAWRGADRAAATISDLLTHSAGLPAVVPLYERAAGRAAFERAICGLPLEFPPGSASLYSDLGFMLLGFILSDAGGASLEAQLAPLAENLAAPGDTPMRFGPVSAWDGEWPGDERVAPTQIDAWRGGRLLRGEVDDRNAAALGGVAGHAGLFGTTGAVGRFAREMLRARRGDVTTLDVRPATVARFTSRVGVPRSSRALGWDTMLPTSSCGTLMSAAAFGHTGYTGTSVWIDPAADVYAVLLTNRVHPAAGSADPIRRLRRAFHDAVMRAVERA